MRTTILNLTVISVITSVVFIACADSVASEKKSTAMTNEEKIQRGAYLVNSIGCDDCHSPKEVTATGFEIIPELRLSGYSGTTSLK